MRALTNEERKGVEDGAREGFDAYVAAVNALDADAWASFYSGASPVTAVAGADVYGDKASWAKAVGGYFAQRVSQRLIPKTVRVRALADGLALLISEQAAAMTLRDGTAVSALHVYTMLWKKEPDGWRIIHSHESWVDE